MSRPRPRAATADARTEGMACRVRTSGLAALRLLQTCPLMPVDAFVALLGLGSRSSGYQQLARLRRAGLAEVRRVDLGYLLGERPTGLWELTDAGQQAVRTVRVLPRSEDPGIRGVLPYGPPDPEERRTRARESDLPLVVAEYRVLATLASERNACGEPVLVVAWERPWVRSVWSPGQGTVLRVRLPAAAVLMPRGTVLSSTATSARPTPVLVLPDLGTAPVIRYREALRRLLILRVANEDREEAGPEPELLVATPDPDGRGTRKGAWLELLDKLARQQDQPALPAQVWDWERVADAVGRAHVPGLVADRGCSAAGRERTPRWRVPIRRAEQVLHLVGRHPFLTLDQLAALLGTAPARLSSLEQHLVERGWLRWIPLDELPHDAIPRDEASRLGCVEITLAGRRQLAAWLGLDVPSATRHHGLIGDGLGQAGLRRRLLRTLAHTLGVNAVFVAFVLAARAAAGQGGTDELVEWRGAAACERRRCKPDGYGRYRRNGVGYGFLLEYDRGTEPPRKYAAKFRAYYGYRDRGDAARDYEGFPTLLFVTTDPTAEERIAEQAYRACLVHGSEPLPVLITSTDRIVGQPEGILGRIWRTPVGSNRQYWLPGEPPRGLFGAGRGPAPTLRLVWSTAGQARERSRAGKGAV